MEPLRVLQVGLGDWGRDWAWRVVPEVGEVDLVGYVDADPTALNLLQELARVSPERCFLNLEEALEGTHPEAVLVTTTLPGHAPVTQAALNAGMHVLVEKPFAENLQVAEKLVELATAQQKVLMVSQNYRFFPATRTVTRLVKEAALGPLNEVSIDFRRYSPVGPGGRGRHHLEDQPLLVDMSIHHFDLLRLILGREPERVQCTAWNPSWSAFNGPSVAVASIEFDNVVVSYRGSWVSAGPVTPWAGEWRMDFRDGEIFWTSRDDAGAAKDRILVTSRTGKSKTVPLQTLGRPDRWGTLSEFATSIRAGREPECSGRDNLATLAFVAAAVESATRQQPVQLSLGSVTSQLAI